MTTVADILSYIESIAPPYMAESWDNVGLLCGRKTMEVKKILVARGIRCTCEYRQLWSCQTSVRKHKLGSAARAFR